MERQLTDEAEIKRGPGRPRKIDTEGLSAINANFPAASANELVRVRCVIEACWDAAGRHEQGEEFATSAEDAQTLISLKQVEKC